MQNTLITYSDPKHQRKQHTNIKKECKTTEPRRAKTTNQKQQKNETENPTANHQNTFNRTAKKCDIKFASILNQNPTVFNYSRTYSHKTNETDQTNDT